MNRQLTVLSQIIVFLINTLGITLILTVISTGVQKQLRNIFIGMVCLMFVWVDFAFLARMTSNEFLALESIKIAWSITPLLFVLIFMFLVRYFNLLKQYKSKIIGLLIGSGVFFLVIMFTDTIIMDIAYNSNDKLAILYGDYVWFFFFFIFLMTILNFRVLLREFKQVKTDNKKRKRIGLLLIGLTFFFVMNAIFNIGLPVFGRVVHLYEYGDYSTIVFLIIIAYATMRLGFFGARIVVTSFVISFLGSFLLLDAIIFTQNIYQAVGKGIIFLIFIPFAILLLRSVLSEIEQRKKLQEANVKLGELTRQQQDIIDVMGHEIRTPLTAIVQELNLQKNIFLPKIKEFKKALDEKKAKTLGYVAEGLDTIDKASKQAVDLVNDMLETARLDKDRFKLDYSEFDITQLIADSVQVMSKTTEADVDIQVKLPDDDEITIEADRKRIKEGLYALLNNAIKYRDKSKEENWIKVCLSINEDMVEISVIDNGIGIREEDIPKLGKKFFRLDGEMKGGVKKPGGTGLGLYVVCGIMKHHKGELIIESEGLGNGSIFTMRFPKS